MLIAFCVGGVVLIASSIVGIATSNGYGAYKNAVKKLIKSDNYTMSVKSYAKVDGEIKIPESSYFEMYNAKAPNKLYKYDMDAEGKITYETYYQDNIEISGYLDDETGIMRYRNYGKCEDVCSSFSNFNGNEKLAERTIKFAEIAIDLLTGDAKNNFVYNGEENGYDSYTISLDSFQIPEIITAGIDVISAEQEKQYENGDYSGSETNNVIKDMRIENVTLNVLVDKDGNIAKNDVSILLGGKDYNDESHTLEYILEMECKDFGTTNPKTLDLENTPNIVDKDDIEADKED